jgi:hypothetical protein
VEKYSCGPKTQNDENAEKMWWNTRSNLAPCRCSVARRTLPPEFNLSLINLDYSGRCSVFGVRCSVARCTLPLGEQSQQCRKFTVPNLAAAKWRKWQ